MLHSLPHGLFRSTLRLTGTALAATLFLGSRVVSADDSALPPARDVTVAKIVNGVEASRLEETVRALATFPTRHTLSGAGGVEPAATYLYNRFSSIAHDTGGRLQVARETWTQPAGTRLPEPHEMTDIVATLPGSETPERVVVISGHYDSRVTDVMNATGKAPGANDDASGVAVVLELARLFAAAPQLPCTVVFTAVTGEEQGLYGSTHLAENMASENRNIVAMLNNDIVGNSRGQDGARDDRHVRVFSAGWNPTETTAQATARRAAGTDGETPARTLARTVADTCRRYVPKFDVTLVYRNDRYGRGGDHSPFMQLGFAAVRLTEPNEDWHHQHQDVRIEKGIVYGDLPEYVDYAYLTRVAQVNASAPPTPRAGLLGDLSPQSTLRWTVPPGAAACEVLWRKTTSAEWEGSRLFPASVTTAVLPLSKDSYLFGVRAVAANGARSLPGIPVAEREQ